MPKKRQERTTINPMNPTQEVILSENSPWQMKEAYKALRTNVIFSLPGSDSKVLIVTSALPNDGKTSNAINLAISLASLDKRVLLIDSDMRLPSIGATLNLQTSSGLSSVLVGQDTIGEAIFHMDEYGMDVLPAGVIAPDPSQLLQSKYMGLLLKVLRKNYEYIIIDMPPVNTVADASILAPLADGYLLVVRNEKTNYDAVDAMIEQLNFVNAKIIGFIYNDYTSAGKGGHYSHYDNYYSK